MGTKALLDCNTLFRPVGRAELALIEALGFRAFPPRLFWQPIFYPVLNESYATQIARDWNTRDAASGYAGFVTRFEVRRSYLDGFDVHRVGSADALEYWIPSEDLPAFNSAIVGCVAVIASYAGGPAHTA